MLLNNDNDDFLFLKIKKILGFDPKNVNLLKEVFIYHFSAKKRNLSKNYSFNFQRLEFLGDSILSAVISNFLYKKFPDKKEGDLTQIRAKIVCRKNLNELSKKISLEKIFFDRNIIENNNVLGNTLEALIGFTYLEIGCEGCKNFIYKILHQHINLKKLQKEIFSYKVWIIEWCQKNKFITNFNTHLNDKNNSKIVYLSEFVIFKCSIHTIGIGSSKKESEEMAAKKAYFLVKKKTKNKLL
ncbi:ribonuclease III family protein [Blattabacterium cuenoti]|uniref:ribonuclease III family protein n=1 Tax=Blattabacterium cuenoti TaxID=1653831 RepID=UPI00163C67D7|nr:ribonuclease III domain-containing protein [Blattabacterium cuenoti]